MFSFFSGGGLQSSVFSHALVSNQTGQTFTSSEVSTPFTIDAIQSLPNGYEAVIGGQSITITQPGIYLAVADSVINDSALSTGKLAANVLNDGDTGPAFYNLFLPCLAALTDWGEGFQVSLLRVAASTIVQFGAWQSDSSSHSLVGDLFITRLGNIPH